MGRKLKDPCINCEDGCKGELKTDDKGLVKHAVKRRYSWGNSVIPRANCNCGCENPSVN